MKLKKNIIREIFPHLKLKDKNISWFKKLYIYMNILVQLWLISIICLHLLLPYIAKDTYRYQKVNFYTYDEVDDFNSSNYFVQVKEHIFKNQLYEENININIYILNDKNIYGILNPIEWLPNRQTFGVTQGTKVFVGKVNIEKNKVYSATNANENLDALLVHEAVHVMQNNKYGWFYTSFRMPHWVKEGYPIYSARALSIYTEKWLIDYLVNKDADIENWPIFSQDQFYGLLVKHAIEKMNKSVDDLHLGEVAYDEVFYSLLDEYNIGKTHENKK